MLKTSKSPESTIRPGKSGVEDSDDGSDNSGHNNKHLLQGSEQVHQRIDQLI